MPTIFRGRLNGDPAQRIHYFPLAGFYCASAYQYAISAKEKLDPNDIVRDVVVSITFSAMAIEALANETAECVLGNGFEDFVKRRGIYAKKNSGSEILHKHKVLLAHRGHQEVAVELADRVERLVSVRNSLVHYKLGESARKSVIRAMTEVEEGDAALRWSVNFLSKPESVEPGLVDRLSPRLAAECYNTAYDLFCFWNSAEKVEDGMAGFSRVSA